MHTPSATHCEHMQEYGCNRKQQSVVNLRRWCMSGEGDEDAIDLDYKL
jgi:hypothetical protein